jgi:hypothetical protein
MAYTEKKLPIPVPNEESGAEEEVRKNPDKSEKDEAGRGFGRYKGLNGEVSLEPRDAEFMATKVTPNPVSVSNEKTINYEGNKPKVVTKEQMQKAGFDNLRDYLNAQQGLKRRGEPASPTSSSNPLDLEKGNSRGQKAPMAMAVKTTMGQGKRPYDPGSVNNSYIGSKFAKGGVTRSSASKRADGCATKGFTKGRNL